MANMRLMVAALLGAILLSACGTTPTGGEAFSNSPADQNSGDPADQRSTSLSDEKSSATDQKPRSPAEQKLALGIASYENENFRLSMAELKSALHLRLSGKHDQVLAHKYLAFIYCVSRRTRQCRYEFRRALEVDPAFDLEPAEVGHPIWGPIFLSEKSKREK